MNKRGENRMLEIKSFSNIDSGKVFARGEIIDSPDGLYIDGGNKMLKWVAVKGYADDWCIYAHLAENTFDFVERSGNKITIESNIQKVVPCSEEVFNQYRY